MSSCTESQKTNNGSTPVQKPIQKSKEELETILGKTIIEEIKYSREIGYYLGAAIGFTVGAGSIALAEYVGVAHFTQGWKYFIPAAIGGLGLILGVINSGNIKGNRKANKLSKQHPILAHDIQDWNSRF